MQKIKILTLGCNSILGFNFAKNILKNKKIIFYGTINKNSYRLNTDPLTRKFSNIKKYNPSILSAPSKRSYANCVKGKKMWVSSRLGNPEIIFRSKEKKREFAKKNSILIDDLKYNIRDWKSSGGIAIHHTNVNKTIAELKELGL